MFFVPMSHNVGNGTEFKHTVRSSMSHNVGNGTEFKHTVRSICHIMLDTERNLEYIYINIII